ncbi:MAG: hypothetical protein ACRDGM_03170, partial [bacterium]
MLRITTNDTPDQIRDAFGLEEPADKSGDPKPEGSGDSPAAVRMALERPKDGKKADEQKAASEKKDDKAEQAGEKKADEKKDESGADGKVEKKAKGKLRFDSQARIEDLSNLNRTIKTERDEALARAVKAEQERDEALSGKKADGAGDKAAKGDSTDDP